MTKYQWVWHSLLIGISAGANIRVEHNYECLSPFENECFTVYLLRLRRDAVDSDSNHQWALCHSRIEEVGEPLHPSPPFPVPYLSHVQGH